MTVRWHRHKWSKWGEPKEHPNTRMVVWYQDRICAVCNMTKRRDL